MTALSDALTARDTAGSAYLSALGALRTAWVELCARDLTLMNVAGTPTKIETFSGEVDQVVPHGLIHPKYALDGNVAGAWFAAAKAASDGYLATLRAG